MCNLFPNGPLAFHQSCVDDAIKDGRWPVIGHWPFENDEVAWPPPRATWYVRDSHRWTVGEPKVYERDETRSATLEQVKGMDIFSVCPRPELLINIIIDRLVHGNHANYKVRDE